MYPSRDLRRAIGKSAAATSSRSRLRLIRSAGPTAARQVRADGHEQRHTTYMVGHLHGLAASGALEIATGILSELVNPADSMCY